MQDSGSKSSPGPAVEVPFSELRRARRAKLARPMRVRPSEPRDDHFEDLPTSVNASKHGIYFVTRCVKYYKGMRVFVTFPYTSAHDPMTSEYLAEVVRIDTLPKDKFGIAVDLKMTVNMSASYKPGPRA
jgi:hypothetical protein